MRAKRLQKLERASSGGKRIIVVTVRQGHEVEDVKLALSNAGVTPARSDLVVSIPKFRRGADCGSFVPTMLYAMPCV